METPNETFEAPAAAPRRIHPKWFGLGLLVLLMGASVWTMLLSTSGTIAWTSDLDQARQRARDRNQRLFVYLHRPNCPDTAAYDRGLFAQKSTKERLAKMVSVRLERDPGDVIQLYDEHNQPKPLQFDGTPLMLVLTPDLGIVARLDGSHVTEQQFKTYINPTSRPAAEGSP
jgi:hypothetical protein